MSETSVPVTVWLLGLHYLQHRKRHCLLTLRQRHQRFRPQSPDKLVWHSVNVASLMIIGSGAGAFGRGLRKRDLVLAPVATESGSPQASPMPCCFVGCLNLHEFSYLHQPFFQWQHTKSRFSAAISPGVLFARCSAAELDGCRGLCCDCGTRVDEGSSGLVPGGLKTTRRSIDTAPFLASTL